MEDNISTQLTVKDFKHAQLHMLYRLKAVKYLAFIGIILLLFVPLMWFTSDFSPIPTLLMGLFMTVGLPGFAIAMAPRLFRNTPRLSEIIHYSFTNDRLHAKGESFDVSFTWDKLYGFSENKHAIFLWQTPQLANIIPKRYLTPLQINEIRTWIGEVKPTK